MDDSQVETLVERGGVAEIAAYCETDVVNTYRVWLIYELFRGRLDNEGDAASEGALRDFLRASGGAKPYLSALELSGSQSAEFEFGTFAFALMNG